MFFGGGYAIGPVDSYGSVVSGGCSEADTLHDVGVPTCSGVCVSKEDNDRWCKPYTRYSLVACGGRDSNRANLGVGTYAIIDSKIDNNLLLAF